MTSILTIDGYKLEIGPVSPMGPKAVELQYKRQFPEPKRPTYTIEGVAGSEEVLEHDSTTVSTEEEKLALLEWEREHSEWMAQISFRLLKLFLSEGVTLKLTKKQNLDLIRRSEAIGISVPDDKYQRDLFFLETFIVIDEARIQQVTDAVMAETGIKPEAIAAAEELFRAEME